MKIEPVNFKHLPCRGDLTKICKLRCDDFCFVSDLQKGIEKLASM